MGSQSSHTFDWGKRTLLFVGWLAISSNVAQESFFFFLTKRIPSLPTFDSVYSTTAETQAQDFKDHLVFFCLFILTSKDYCHCYCTIVFWLIDLLPRDWLPCIWHRTNWLTWYWTLVACLATFLQEHALPLLDIRSELVFSLVSLCNDEGARDTKRNVCNQWKEEQETSETVLKERVLGRQPKWNILF